MRTTPYPAHALFPFLLLGAALAGGATESVGAPWSSGSTRSSGAGPRILVFSGLVGFRHESIPDAVAAVQAIGLKRGWTVDATADAAAFTAANLARYDAVVWNNNCGNDDTREILTPAQKTAFEGFLQSGRGSVGTHCSSCAGQAGPGDWTWYNDMIGAVNTGHPGGALQFQTARILVEDKAHPATRHLPAAWSLKDEWFYYNRSPRPDVHVLLALDETSYQPGTAMGDHPIAWSRNYKGGRVFYTGIGHMREVYADSNYLKHLEGGILWASGWVEPPRPPRLAAAGLILDLDADKGLTLDAGDRVSGWKNQVAAFRAQDFLKNDKGRSVPGSGRPTLRRALPGWGGHNTLSFKAQELLNSDEDAFDDLTRGKGYTWLAVMAAYAQAPGGLADVNSFFGNLRNGGNYEGLWGGFDDNRTLWCGSRNGVSFGRWDANNPKVSGPILAADRPYLLAGRMEAGTGTVAIELFAGQAGAPVAAGRFPVSAAANPSKLAIGTERDADNHPGHESFDGEIARFLVYDRPLTDIELAEAFESLRRTYLEGVTSLSRPAAAGPARFGFKPFDLLGRLVGRPWNNRWTMPHPLPQE